MIDWIAIQIPISTHAPLARCDGRGFGITLEILNFNSRTSCEVRHTATETVTEAVHFNSRTSCEVRRLWFGKHTEP